MGYYEFNIEVAEESRDALIEKMSEMGCLGIIDNEKTLTVYFSDNDGIDSILPEINSFAGILKKSGLDDKLSFKYEFISERDWNESWKKKFVPINVGDNLAILPPWETPVTGRTNLIVDPGMAFGTGHHETTRTCLLLIERFSKNLDKESFLDIGTGTGVLAIAASKFGYKRVVGVDTDPLAVDAAERNVRHNDLHNVEIKLGSAADVEGTFDFVAANILSEVLINIAHDIAVRIKPSGIAMLSGMLTGQDEDVLPVMESEGLKLLEKVVDGRWISLILTR